MTVILEQHLIDETILIPSAYRAMKNGTLEMSKGFKFPMVWVAKNVKLILENQVYLGQMVSHKTHTKSFKNKKLVSIPKEDWIIVKNTHETMIDEEIFAPVQKFINIKKQPNKTKKPNMFVRFVKCPTCERNMALSGTLEKGKWLCCRTYTRNTNLCTSHIISFEAL